ncbi:signal peptidase II [Gemmatimonas aurantiaca]|nr:signal peptidase II [Gemmatimonas aurantiaca]
MTDSITEHQTTTSALDARRSYFAPALILAALIAIADQLTKIWILDHFAEGGSTINIWGDTIRFILVYNYGGALGTTFGSPSMYLIMGLLIFCGLLYYLWSARHIRSFSLTLGLIAGGAIGNLTDRVRLGKVVDWIDIDIPDIPWFGGELERFWTFNIADSAITVALVFLLLSYLRAKSDEEPESSAVSAEHSAEITNNTRLDNQ